MTYQEIQKAKEKMIHDDVLSIENRLRHAFNQGFELGCRVGKEAVPMSVIEDIKAEIDKQYKWLKQTKLTLYDIDIAFDAINASIDKHISGKEK